MNNRQAFEKAKRALDKADEASGKAYVDHGGGWGDMDTLFIHQHILEYLAYEFKQGPKPEDYPDE